MAIGPIQLLVIGFDRIGRPQWQVYRELEARSDGHGTLRVLDMLCVSKDSDDLLTILPPVHHSGARRAMDGRVIASLLGLAASDSSTVAGDAAAFTTASHEYGLSRADLADVSARIAPGSSGLLLLVEHPWVLHLQAIVQPVGGKLLAQGALTADTLIVCGAELQVRSGAESAIALMRAVKGAALLHALADVTPGAVATTVAHSIRALIVAGLLTESAADDAIDAVVKVGLIDAATVDAALQLAVQRAVESQRALAAIEEIAQNELT